MREPSGAIAKARGTPSRNPRVRARCRGKLSVPLTWAIFAHFFGRFVTDSGGLWPKYGWRTAGVRLGRVRA
jgi:hypothetical protein